MIEQIKERWSNARQSPWEYESNHIWDANGYDFLESDFATDIETIAAIVAAPADIAYLLERVEQREKMLNIACSKLEDYCPQQRSAKRWLEWLEQEAWKGGE